MQGQMWPLSGLKMRISLKNGHWCLRSTRAQYSRNVGWFHCPKLEYAIHHFKQQSHDHLNACTSYAIINTITKMFLRVHVQTNILIIPCKQLSLYFPNSHSSSSFKLILQKITSLWVGSLVLNNVHLIQGNVNKIILTGDMHIDLANHKNKTHVPSNAQKFLNILYSCNLTQIISSFTIIPPLV